LRCNVYFYLYLHFTSTQNKDSSVAQQALVAPTSLLSTDFSFPRPPSLLPLHIADTAVLIVTFQGHVGGNVASATASSFLASEKSYLAFGKHCSTKQENISKSTYHHNRTSLHRYSARPSLPFTHRSKSTYQSMRHTLSVHPPRLISNTIHIHTHQQQPKERAHKGNTCARATPSATTAAPAKCATTG